MGVVLAVHCSGADARGTPADQFRREFLLSFNTAENQSVRLAEAVAAEKYGWRPGAGVRSTSEVFVHIANGNELLLRLVNGSSKTTKDAGFQKTIASNAAREKTVTAKADVVGLMKHSFEEVHSALEKASDADLNREVEFFGTTTTVRGVFLVIGNHVNEHLGQSIAYARMNGIVPPWSQ